MLAKPATGPGRFTIGTNPSDPNQYYGSVVAHGSAPDVLLTAFS